MGATPVSGEWTAWQWNLKRQGDRDGRIGFDQKGYVYKCTDSLNKLPKYPPHLCWGTMCQEKAPAHMALADFLGMSENIDLISYTPLMNTHPQ